MSVRTLSLSALALLALSLGACSTTARSEPQPATGADSTNTTTNTGTGTATTTTTGVNATTTLTQIAALGQPAPNFTLPASTGENHSLADYAGKWVVLEWVNYGCPFVKAHYDSGEIQQHQQYANDHDMVWLSICSSAPGKQGHFEGEALTAQIAAHNAAGTAYLIDAAGTVGKSYDAKTTPNMYVINPEGVLVYAGALDDHPSTVAAEIAGATNYIEPILTTAQAGGTVEPMSTTPYGCGIKYP